MNDKKILELKRTLWHKLLFLIIPFLGAFVFGVLIFSIEVDAYYRVLISLVYYPVLLLTSLLCFLFEKKMHILKSLILAAVFYYYCVHWYFALFPRSEILSFYETILENDRAAPRNLFVGLAVVLILHLTVWLLKKYRLKKKTTGH